MSDIPPIALKPLTWVGPAYSELMSLPAQVRRNAGYALWFAQAGETPDHVKPLRGFKGAGVLEVIADHDGNAYRAVYTVKLDGIVYVLHCFQKKSKRGIATPKTTIELIRQRLRAAISMHEQGSDRP
jgi:phage-related protein